MIGRASDPLFKLIRVAVIVVAAVAISSGSASAQLRFDLLHSFSASPADGSNSSAPLIQGSDGNFYGTTYNGGSSAKGTVFRITATGNFMVLHSFMGSDGDTPYSSLLQASDGNFYGTTYFGGAFNLGTVYRINATGAFTVIHSFGGVAAGDGAQMRAPRRVKVHRRTSAAASRRLDRRGARAAARTRRRLPAPSRRRVAWCANARTIEGY